MNKFIGIGLLGRDPEVTTSKSGMVVAKFSIAIKETYKNKQTGEYDTDWLPITAFGKKAELIGSYVKKGSKILVVGKVKPSSYEKDGQKIYRTDIILDEVEFLTPKGTNTQPQQNTTQGNNNNQSQQNNDDFADLNDDSEIIPF